MRSRRAQWAERVRQWRRSGLTAREFARRAGINAGTLQYWAWRLRRDHDTRGGGNRLQRERSRTSFVELVAGAIDDRRFELECGDGWRLRIPAQFDRAGLEQLLAVVAKAPR